MRWKIAAVALLVAAGMVWWAGRPGLNAFASNMLLNIATEVAGIVVTVAVIDKLFETKREKDEAKQTAWRALHDVDRAVWVWQGGRGECQLDELLALLAQVQDTDVIPDFTETLFLRIGSAAELTQRLRPDLLKRSPELATGLFTLRQLAAIRERRGEMTPRHIAGLFSTVVPLLATAAKEQISTGGGEIRRDPSVEAQERRHWGK